MKRQSIASLRSSSPHLALLASCLGWLACLAFLTSSQAGCGGSPFSETAPCPELDSGAKCLDTSEMCDIKSPCTEGQGEVFICDPSVPASEINPEPGSLGFLYQMPAYDHENRWCVLQWHSFSPGCVDDGGVQVTTE